jgi:hypothetical protein
VTGGAGLQVADWLIVAVLALAGVTQLAVALDASIVETRQGTACRFLIAVGMCAMATRFAWVLVDVGDIALPRASILILMLVGVGHLAQAVDILMRPKRGRRAGDCW